MDVYEAVRTVLAVRRYQDKPVPEVVLQKVLEAGRLTGSSINLQPWAFVVVQDKATLAKVAAAAKSGPYIAQAPAAIAVAIERSSRYGVSDASRAIQAMVLTAWSEGVGSNWVGFGGMDGVRELLNIPAHMDVLAVLSLGYPAQRLGAGKKNRKALSEVAHRGRWGVPWG